MLLTETRVIPLTEQEFEDESCISSVSSSSSLNEEADSGFNDSSEEEQNQQQQQSQSLLLEKKLLQEQNNILNNQKTMDSCVESNSGTTTTVLPEYSEELTSKLVTSSFHLRDNCTSILTSTLCLGSNVAKNVTNHDECHNISHPSQVKSVKRRKSLKKLESDGAAAVDPPMSLKFTVYFCYLVLIAFGYIRMILERIGILADGMCKEKNRENYPPIYKSWQPFFAEYIYRRVSDIFGQPIAGNPGGIVRVLERVSPDYNRSFHLTGKSYDCINLASYDYLGFSKHTECDVIEQSIRKYGVGIAPMSELGRIDKHEELERMMAEFVGKEDCVVFGMGFATNAANISAMVSDCKNTLILGDQHSHASVRAGMYLSRASFKFFKHNDFDDLERKIRTAIAYGNPKTNAPYRKIIIIVEGVYSMEGTIVDLPKLVELKKRYKCYLYIDEAHSIGAVGPHGKGVCDYFGVNPADVDLLMGTMTKSFAAAGGYIAGSREMINYIRANSASNYAGSMAAPIAQQIINTLRILMDSGDEGTGKLESHGSGEGQQRIGEGQQRIGQLLSNTHYMREKLKKLGFIIYGHKDSPVIPIMVFFPSKVGSMVRMGVRNGLALVAAGYPATTLPTCRIRLCMSAALTRENLDKAIEILSWMGDVHQIKYAKY